MEESYETFEEELGTPRANPPPQKPVQQISRPEMFATRKIREEMVPASQEPGAEPKTSPKEKKESTLHTTASLHKTVSIQNLTQMDTPWENVTLNRCLFVAITILVLTSGFQRLHDTLRGQGTPEDEEEVGLRVRKSGTLRHRGKPQEPETSLWEVIFWWLPDLDDEEDDDEDDDNQVKRGRSMKRATAQRSRGFRNRPMLDKNIMKQNERKFKDKRTKKAKVEETKGKKDREKKNELNQADDKEANEEDNDQKQNNEVHKKSKKLEKQKKKTQNG